MTEDKVVTEITRRAWVFGVAVLLSPEPYVLVDDLQCSGYFDGEADVPLLAVATGTERWLGTLLHEYSHLTQWAEDAPIWRSDRSAAWQDWLAGKSVKNIRAQIAASRELEADCERRTIRLIRELDAPVNVEQYARGANAYIHFYNVIADKRKWYSPQTRPYSMDNVLAAANPTLDSDFTKTPKALYSALLTCI